MVARGKRFGGKGKGRNCVIFPDRSHKQRPSDG